MVENGGKPGKADLLAHLKGPLALMSTLELEDAGAAKDALEGAFPSRGDFGRRFMEIARAGIDAGWLCDRAAGPARFSRVSKAVEDTHGFSVDAVLSSGAGMEHTHPGGEINLCLSMSEGAPTFDGHDAGWVVYPPGTRHHPDVVGGTMLLLYFLPGGEIEWHR